jgi:transposase
MGAPRKYSQELRERATRLARDARRDPAMSRGSMSRIADQLGVHREALRTWVQRAEVDAGHRPGMMTDDASKIAALEREVRELRRANAILKSASASSSGKATRWLGAPWNVSCGGRVCEALPV